MQKLMHALSDAHEVMAMKVALCIVYGEYTKCTCKNSQAPCLALVDSERPVPKQSSA